MACKVASLSSNAESSIFSIRFIVLDSVVFLDMWKRLRTIVFVISAGFFHAALSFSQSRAKLATEVASEEDSLRVGPPFSNPNLGYLDGVLGVDVIACF